MKLPIEVKKVIDIINSNGQEAYVVGGFVRDYLLNKDSYDVDITTSARCEVLEKLFKDYKLNENFTNLGCIKFSINKYNFEITTFRKEYNYINHRKPSKVEFTNDLKEDLVRRDFTINAICSNGINIIDLFNGIDDLNNKIIKTIGEANIRFEEDALRILRAFRFASKLDFEISEETSKAIFKNYHFLNDISLTTLHKELIGILEGNSYLKILKEYEKVFKDVFKLNELKINLFKDNMSIIEKEALFFYYSDIKINNKYLVNKDIDFINDKINLKYKLNKYGYENIYNLLYFKCSYLNENKEIFEILKEIELNKECYNLKMLDINGNDLLKLNIKEDKIGKYLNLLLEAVIEDKCCNSKNELLNYLNEIEGRL